MYEYLVQTIFGNHMICDQFSVSITHISQIEQFFEDYEMFPKERHHSYQAIVIHFLCHLSHYHICH